MTPPAAQKYTENVAAIQNMFAQSPSPRTILRDAGTASGHAAGNAARKYHAGARFNCRVSLK
jgi:hypothetical protein